jgi:hypothetical protein
MPAILYEPPPPVNRGGQDLRQWSCDISSMQTVAARISASFCPGAISIP